MPIASISDAMDRIVVLQAALSITSPVTQSIQRAYKYTPKRSSAAPDRPFWMNSWTLVNQRRLPGGWDRALYQIQMQLCVENANLDVAADIATAFHEAFLVALDADITLNAGNAIQNVRGADPTLVLHEWSGQSFIGLDMLADVDIARVRTLAA